MRCCWGWQIKLSIIVYFGDSKKNIFMTIHYIDWFYGLLVIILSKMIHYYMNQEVMTYRYLRIQKKNNYRTLNEKNLCISFFKVVRFGLKNVSPWSRRCMNQLLGRPFGYLSVSFWWNNKGTCFIPIYNSRIMIHVTIYKHAIIHTHICHNFHVGCVISTNSGFVTFKKYLLVVSDDLGTRSTQFKFIGHAHTHTP